MTAAFKGGLTFQILDETASPGTYRTITEAASISGLGQTNPLIDATSFDSTSKEYIAGLADGQEITIECAYVMHDTAQDYLRTNVISGSNRTFKATFTNANASPTTEVFTFTGTCLSFVLNPSFDDKNTLTFTVKISGSITIT